MNIRLLSTVSLLLLLQSFLWQIGAGEEMVRNDLSLAEFDGFCHSRESCAIKPNEESQLYPVLSTKRQKRFFGIIKKLGKTIEKSANKFGTGIRHAVRSGGKSRGARRSRMRPSGGMRSYPSEMEMGMPPAGFGGGRNSGKRGNRRKAGRRSKNRRRKKNRRRMDNGQMPFAIPPPAGSNYEPNMEAGQMPEGFATKLAEDGKKDRSLSVASNKGGDNEPDEEDADEGQMGMEEYGYDHDYMPEEGQFPPSPIHHKGSFPNYGQHPNNGMQHPQHQENIQQSHIPNNAFVNHSNKNHPIVKNPGNEHHNINHEPPHHGMKHPPIMAIQKEYVPPKPMPVFNTNHQSPNRMPFINNTHKPVPHMTEGIHRPFTQHKPPVNEKHHEQMPPHQKPHDAKHNPPNRPLHDLLHRTSDSKTPHHAAQIPTHHEPIKAFHHEVDEEKGEEKKKSQIEKIHHEKNRDEGPIKHVDSMEPHNGDHGKKHSSEESERSGSHWSNDDTIPLHHDNNGFGPLQRLQSAMPHSIEHDHGKESCAEEKRKHTMATGAHWMPTSSTARKPTGFGAGLHNKSEEESKDQSKDIEHDEDKARKSANIGRMPTRKIHENESESEHENEEHDEEEHKPQAMSGFGSGLGSKFSIGGGSSPSGMGMGMNHIGQSHLPTTGRGHKESESSEVDKDEEHDHSGMEHEDKHDAKDNVDQKPMSGFGSGLGSKFGMGGTQPQSGLGMGIANHLAGQSQFPTGHTESKSSEVDKDEEHDHSGMEHENNHDENDNIDQKTMSGFGSGFGSKFGIGGGLPPSGMGMGNHLPSGHFGQPQSLGHTKSESSEVDADDHNGADIEHEGSKENSKAHESAHETNSDSGRGHGFGMRFGESSSGHFGQPSVQSHPANQNPKEKSKESNEDAQNPNKMHEIAPTNGSKFGQGLASMGGFGGHPLQGPLEALHRSHTIQNGKGSSKNSHEERMAKSEETHHSAHSEEAEEEEHGYDHNAHQPIHPHENKSLTQPDIVPTQASRFGQGLASMAGFNHPSHGPLGILHRNATMPNGNDAHKESFEERKNKSEEIHHSDNTEEFEEDHENGHGAHQHQLHPNTGSSIGQDNIGSGGASSGFGNQRPVGFRQILPSAILPDGQQSHFGQGILKRPTMANHNMANNLPHNHVPQHNNHLQNHLQPKSGFGAGLASKFGEPQRSPIGFGGHPVKEDTGAVDEEIEDGQHQQDAQHLPMHQNNTVPQHTILPSNTIPQPLNPPAVQRPNLPLPTHHTPMMPHHIPGVPPTIHQVNPASNMHHSPNRPQFSLPRPPHLLHHNGHDDKKLDAHKQIEERAEEIHKPNTFGNNASTGIHAPHATETEGPKIGSAPHVHHSPETGQRHPLGSVGSLLPEQPKQQPRVPGFGNHLLHGQNWKPPNPTHEEHGEIAPKPFVAPMVQPHNAQAQHDKPHLENPLTNTHQQQTWHGIDGSIKENGQSKNHQMNPFSGSNDVQMPHHINKPPNPMVLNPTHTSQMAPQSRFGERNMPAIVPNRILPTIANQVGNGGIGLPFGGIPLTLKPGTFGAIKPNPMMSPRIATAPNLIASPHHQPATGQQSSDPLHWLRSSIPSERLPKPPTTPVGMQNNALVNPTTNEASSKHQNHPTHSPTMPSIPAPSLMQPATMPQNPMAPSQSKPHTQHSPLIPHVNHQNETRNTEPGHSSNAAQNHPAINNEGVPPSPHLQNAMYGKHEGPWHGNSNGRQSESVEEEGSHPISHENDKNPVKADSSFEKFSWRSVGKDGAQNQKAPHISGLEKLLNRDTPVILGESEKKQLQEHLGNAHQGIQKAEESFQAVKTILDNSRAKSGVANGNAVGNDNQPQMHQQNQPTPNNQIPMNPPLSHQIPQNHQQHTQPNNHIPQPQSMVNKNPTVRLAPLQPKLHLWEPKSPNRRMPQPTIRQPMLVHKR